MKVISIVNLKGGVGKTVTAVNMAAILATEHNKRVLVIDADPQANATRFFGAQDAPATLCDLFAGRATCYDDIVWQTQIAGVDIAPATIDLLAFDVAAATEEQGIVRMLSDLCAAAEEDSAYDYVIIDCPPGFTAVSISGIAASDDVIIPAVDAAPWRYGRWIEYTKVIIPEPYNKWEQAWKCSECGFDDGFVAYNYCPNCGAKMEGGDGDDDAE